MIYHFKGGSDGANPEGGLIVANGTLYGTTSAGGGPASFCAQGCGTLFAIDMSGREHIVYRFQGGRDGTDPQGDLLAFNGMLYGVTEYGGSFSGSFGAVFAISPSGSGGVIYRFTGGADGRYPMSGLTLDRGILYGTTSGGDACNSGSNCGDVFTITPWGMLHVVHEFNGSDGNFPASSLVNVDGTLYGTTYYGGKGCILNGCGTIYTLDATGTERVVWLFGGNQDGVSPAGSLALWHGKIYGTTQEGGNAKCYRKLGCGTIFVFDPSTRHEAVVHQFQNSDGAWPLTGVTVYNKALYGTTNEGGTQTWGTVFRATL